MKIVHTAEYQLQLLQWQPTPLVQTNVCGITAHLPIVYMYVTPSSICATPLLDFISPDVWPPNSPDLSGRLQNLGLSSRSMFIRSAHATSTSWNSIWLMYGQTFGRQSLTGPSISGESGFRPLSVWKDAISNMSCKSSLFLLTFYGQIFRFCRFFLGIANVYRCYSNWEAGTRRHQWLFWCHVNFIVWITEIYSAVLCLNKHLLHVVTHRNCWHRAIQMTGGCRQRIKGSWRWIPKWGKSRWLSDCSKGVVCVFRRDWSCKSREGSRREDITDESGSVCLGDSSDWCNVENCD